MAPTNPDLTDPALQFLQTLWSLDHALQSHSKRMKAESGVTGPQRLVLRLLSLDPTHAPSDLARLLHFHRSTITIILKGLVDERLIRRSPNPKDGRAVLLTLTPKGRAIAEQRSGTVEAVVRKTLAGLSLTEIRATRRVLDALALALE